MKWMCLSILSVLVLPWRGFAQETSGPASPASKAVMTNGADQQAVDEVYSGDPVEWNTLTDSLSKWIQWVGDSAFQQIIFSVQNHFDSSDSVQLRQLEDWTKHFSSGEFLKWMELDDIQELSDRHFADDRPFLGVILDTEQPLKKGIVVMNIVQNSAAEAAGILKEDVLLSIDGRNTDGMEGLVAALAPTKIGQTVEVEVERNGRTVRLKATLKSRAESKFDLNTSLQLPIPPCCKDPGCNQVHSGLLQPALIHRERAVLGVYLQELDEEMIRDLRVKGGKGALITHVISGSTADSIGLKTNDVIVTVNDHPVDNPSELQVRFRELQRGDALSVGIMRYGVRKLLTGSVNQEEPISSFDRDFFFFHPEKED